jgi:hypothetical protein
MASELRLDMRSDGYVRVRDLLGLNLQTFARVPLKAHTVDEIKEVKQPSRRLHRVTCLLALLACIVVNSHWKISECCVSQ